MEASKYHGYLMDVENWGRDLMISVADDASDLRTGWNSIEQRKDGND